VYLEFKFDFVAEMQVIGSSDALSFVSCRTIKIISRRWCCEWLDLWYEHSNIRMSE